MAGWQEEYIERYYGRTPGWIDLHTRWKDLLSRHIAKGARVLEIGPGPTNAGTEHLSTIAGRLIGLDIDSDTDKNSFLDELHVYGGSRFPFPDNYFDAVVSRWVNEHLKDPLSHCMEISRVLSPGGKYIFRTPNLFHYASITARLTPHWFHVRVANRLRNHPPDHHHPYPTYYRLNTRKRIVLLLTRSGMTVETLQVKETYPVYGQAWRPMFYLLMVYERVVNSTKRLEWFRHTIDGVAVKN